MFVCVRVRSVFDSRSFDKTVRLEINEPNTSRPLFARVRSLFDKYNKIMIFIYLLGVYMGNSYQ